MLRISIRMRVGSIVLYFLFLKHIHISKCVIFTLNILRKHLIEITPDSGSGCGRSLRRRLDEPDWELVAIEVIVLGILLVRWYENNPGDQNRYKLYGMEDEIQ